MEPEAELAGRLRPGPDLAGHGVLRRRRAGLVRALEQRFGVRPAERSISCCAALGRVCSGA